MKFNVSALLPVLAPRSPLQGNAEPAVSHMTPILQPVGRPRGWELVQGGLVGSSGRTSVRRFSFQRSHTFKAHCWLLCSIAMRSLNWQFPLRSAAKEPPSVPVSIPSSTRQLSRSADSLSRFDKNISLGSIDEPHRSQFEHILRIFIEMFKHLLDNTQRLSYKLQHSRLEVFRML